MRDWYTWLMVWPGRLRPYSIKSVMYLRSMEIDSSMNGIGVVAFYFCCLEMKRYKVWFRSFVHV